MSRLRVVAGGSPSRAQAAAILSAIETVLAQQPSAVSDATPTAYRSNWRRAGIDAACRGNGRPARGWSRT